MSPWSWVAQYAVAIVAFTVLDVIWLGTVAKDLYAAHIGHLLAPKANLPAAIAFYAIFLAGLVFFVIHPAIAEGSWTKALLVGAAFGFVTYATWDLTQGPGKVGHCGCDLGKCVGVTGVACVTGVAHEAEMGVLVPTLS
ncbi:MAG: DUF2177 family protein, partial [Dermatophilaceae bacterium]|nr:DUF2177 family protein [Dermatophilaceae bacterium]